MEIIELYKQTLLGFIFVIIKRENLYIIFNSQWANLLLLARLESAYSLICGAREFGGKGGGETLALLW